MVNEYYNKWQDLDRAEFLLNRAIAEYVRYSTDSNAIIEPIDTFSLNRHEPAVNQLVEFHSDLRLHSIIAANNFIEAAARIYNSSVSSMPVSFFNSAILGGFLISCASDKLRPNIEMHMKLLRPLADSNKQSENNLYYGAVLRVADCCRKAIGTLRTSAATALEKEWGFQLRVDAPSASIARVLVGENSSEWPFYLSSCLGSILRVENGLSGDPENFVRAAQNIMLEVNAEDFAKHFWKLAPFIDEDPTRADILAFALFGGNHAQLDSSLSMGAPYELFSENTNNPEFILSQCSVKRSNAPQNEQAYFLWDTPREERLKAEFLTDHYSMCNFILFVVVVGEVGLAA